MSGIKNTNVPQLISHSAKGEYGLDSTDRMGDWHGLPEIYTLNEAMEAALYLKADVFGYADYRIRAWDGWEEQI